MSTCCFYRARRHLQGGGSELRDNLLRRESSDAVVLQEPLDRRKLQSSCPRWMGRKLQKVPEPGLVRGRGESKQLRKVAVKLFAQPVLKTVRLLSQIFVDPRQLTKLHREWSLHTDLSKAGTIRSQGVGEHEGIASIILGASHRVTITKAIELFRVDGVHMEPAFDQEFDDRTAGYFDRDLTRPRLHEFHQCIHELHETGSTVLNRSLFDDLTLGTEHADLMSDRGPVDADEVAIRFFHQYPSVVLGRPRCDVSPVLALEARLPTGRAPRRISSEHRSPPGSSKRRGQKGASDEMAETKNRDDNQRSKQSELVGRRVQGGLRLARGMCPNASTPATGCGRCRVANAADLVGCSLAAETLREIHRAALSISSARNPLRPSPISPGGRRRRTTCHPWTPSHVGR